MRRRDQRLIAVVAAFGLIAMASWLTMAGLRRSAVYFYAPSDIAAKAEAGRTVRIGGLVEAGSIAHDADGAVRFVVTDGPGRLEVRYAGVLPDLFREGQGVVAEGVYAPGAAFQATQVLAKHDETYMPREVAEALKQRGEWRGGE